ncbi:MAG TPA: hypothetical protein VI687_00150, partial [Candidatus Limnocylindrales bacterium]|nr:hypothetical protein [Candidatus Limnocylindrales bacterium]
MKKHHAAGRRPISAPSQPARVGWSIDRRIRAAAFGIVVVAIIGGGVVLAAGDLLGQRGTATT